MLKRLRATAAAMRMQVAVRSEALEDVEVAVRALEGARDRSRPGSAAHLIAVRNLANAWHALAVRTSRREDIEAAARAVADALATTPPGHSFRRSMLLVGAANAAVEAMVFVDADAASNGIDLATEALEDARPWRKRPDVVHLLGSAYTFRYVATREIADLREGIRILRELVDSHLAFRERSKSLNNLSAAYTHAYQATGSTLDYDLALHYARMALAESTPANQAEPEMNIARLQRLRRDRAADAAGESGGPAKASSATDPHAGFVPASVSLPGRRDALRSAHRLTDAADSTDLAHLSRAITDLQEVIDGLSTNDPERVVQELNLASMQANLAHASGDADLLDRALVAMRDVEPRLLERSAAHAQCVANIALVLSWRYEASGLADDVEQARHAFRRAVGLAAGSYVDLAVDTASLWLQVEFADFPLDQQARRMAAQSVLTSVVAALSAEQPAALYRRRVELVAPVFAEAVGALAELSDLDAALAAIDRYRTLRAVHDVGRDDIGPAGDSEHLDPAPVTEPRQGGVDEVVYVWAASRSGYLVSRRAGRAPTLTRLPELTAAAVGAQLTDLYTAYDRYRAATSRERSDRLAGWSAQLGRCDSWLWSTAAHGLVGHRHKVAAFVAVGWAEALPWQSAARVRDDGSTVWLADSVRLVFPVSGHVEPTDERPFPLDAVVVSGPAQPGGLDGESAGGSSNGAWYGTLEGDLITDLLGAKRINADDLGVLHTSLEASSLAHFSCHGELDHDNPGRSALMLAGGVRLSASEVAKLDLRGLRLVFLSACETAAVRPLSSDAPEGLSQAFLTAGATCVIGSRWIVNDTSSMVLALEFYARWVEGGLSAGEALHEAQRWLRTASGYELALQLAHHVGPGDTHVERLRARAGDVVWADPFYWASLRLVGQQDVLYVPSPAPHPGHGRQQGDRTP